MLRNRALPLILMASAVALAGCSRSEPGNIAATDNGSVAGLGNDDFGATDNVALANDLPLDNDVALNGTAVR